MELKNETVLFQNVTYVIFCEMELLYFKYTQTSLCHQNRNKTGQMRKGEYKCFNICRILSMDGVLCP